MIVDSLPVFILPLKTCLFPAWRREESFLSAAKPFLKSQGYNCIMVFNQITKSVNVATIIKGGKNVVLAIATETQHWKRTESIARAQEPSFSKSILKSPTALPTGTTKVISRLVP